MKQGPGVQGLVHGRITQVNPQRHQMNTKLCTNGKRRVTRFACRRKVLGQAYQLSPKHNKTHLVKKLTLARSLGDQLKSGGGNGGLFHQAITFASGFAMHFVDQPKGLPTSKGAF